MNRLETVLESLIGGEVAPAVYRLGSRATIATIVDKVEAHGWRCFAIDGNQISDKPSFLKTVGAALNFPGYAGKNWDAFEECLNDLSWAPAAGYVLLYDNVANFARNDPNSWQTALDILTDAVGKWQQADKSFTILLRKTGGRVRTLPKID